MPMVDIKVNWKEASCSSCGVSATINAAAKARTVTALFCRPSSSASRNRLTIIADRMTGGPNPVKMA